ncbi:MAG: hypothetical protein MUO72_05735 [Bacteroidales bacterium]|nr:hypothetical protein [Bacteroidales bacterium]
MVLIQGSIIVCSFANSQIAKRDTAIVSKVRGVPVFVMCEPTSPYEVTGNVSDTDAVSLIDALGGEDTYRTIKQSCEVIVDNAQRRQKRGKINFDAIIISDDGHTGTCIKFI